MSTLDLGFDLDSIMGNKNKGKINFKYLEEGSAVYRILPPFDSANRQLSAEHNFHWVQDEQSKNIKVQCTYFTSEKYCPLCNAAKDLESARDTAKAQEGEKSETYKRLNAAVMKLQKTKSIYYNALTPNNEVVVLQLTKTVSDLLNKKLAEAVQDKNQDPTAITAGYWFKFSKVGKGRDSVTVDFHRTSKVVEGEEVEVMNRTPVPPELAATLPEKVANIFDRKVMWIKEYSGVELSDYLKGIPLKDKFKKKENTSQYGNQQQERRYADEDSKDGGGYAKEEPKQDSAPKTSASEAFAAEAARLRALANGKK